MLTLLGGGAFGNPLPWMRDAAAHGLRQVRGAGLDIRLVSYRAVPQDLRDWAQARSHLL